jgi:hypothetical protein
MLAEPANREGALPGEFLENEGYFNVLQSLGNCSTTLIVLAFAYGDTSGWLLPALLIGAVLLLGGCPACWLTGLFEAIRTRRNVDAGPLN